MQTEEKTLYQLDGVMIGKRIKSVRKAKGLTQEQLAERCGCTSTHISNIENGKIGISIELLYIEEQILFLIKHNPRITQVQIAYELDVPKSTVKYYVGKLSKSKIIKREGTVHNGKWIIL